jgi:hypothetical protein
MPGPEQAPDHPPVDPLALRWVEAGVSGLARRRDWDAVEIVDVPELEGVPLEELRFARLADGTIVSDEAPPIGPAVLERLADRAAEVVRPPFEALAARRTRLQWCVAVREVRLAEIGLPPIQAAELVLAIGPSGEPELLVDGAPPAAMTPELESAQAILERAGRARYDAFVARARRVASERWALSVDPL